MFDLARVGWDLGNPQADYDEYEIALWPGQTDVVAQKPAGAWDVEVISTDTGALSYFPGVPVYGAVVLIAY